MFRKSIPAIAISIATSLTFFSCGDNFLSNDDSVTSTSSEISSSSVALSNSSVVSSSSVVGSVASNAVQIGNQVWMTKNLNYDVPDNDTDVCYDNDPANCEIYGRLYDWVTAMGLSSSCNESSCASQAQKTKHKGICPLGWHIPSKEEWDELYKFAEENADNCQSSSVSFYCPTAGKHLKAEEGWTGCGFSSEFAYLCEDTHGFSALPGGYGRSDGEFRDVGEFANWWSSSEYEDSKFAYKRRMDYNLESSNSGFGSKTYLFSVRCLQD